MIRALLVDDEKNALEMLEWQLHQYCSDVEVLGLCQGADNGIAGIKKFEPDLVFLDVEMPHKNGFEVLTSFVNPRFSTIFTTAYDQYAIMAMRHAAFDYLLKPVHQTDLQQAIDRFRKTNKYGASSQPGLLRAHAALEKVKVAFNTAEGVLFFDPKEIVRCESSNNYCWIYFTNRPRLLVTKTLKQVEETLPAWLFYRIHHSFLINLLQVEKYVKGDGGYVQMTDNKQVTVARNRRDGFLERFYTS